MVDPVRDRGERRRRRSGLGLDARCVYVARRRRCCGRPNRSRGDRRDAAAPGGAPGSDWTPGVCTLPGDGGVAAEATGTANSAARTATASTCAAFRAPTESSDETSTRVMFMFRVPDM